MADMFDKINENAAAVAEADRLERARRAELRIKKANRALACRALIGAALVLLFWLGSGLGLVHWGVAVGVVAAVFVWFAVWLGAWMQFSWAKRGLLK